MGRVARRIEQPLSDTAMPGYEAKMLVLIAALPLLLSTQPAAVDSEEADVRKAFSAYRSALLKKDGNAAADAVDSDTLAYYSQLQAMALKADAATVKKQSIMDRVMIIRLRHEVGTKALQKMGGRELFAYGVDKGWVSASSVETAAMGKVKIAGQEATGEIMVGGQPAPFTFLFKKGENGWRFSLMPLLAMGEPAMHQMAKQEGLEENAFVFAIVEKVSGKPVPETIWEPLLPPPPAPKRKP